MNVAEAVLFHRKFQPDAPALIVPARVSRVITYRDLGQLVDSVSRRASTLGLDRKKIAVIFVRDQVLHIAFLLGLMRLGIATLSIYQTRLPPQPETGIVFTDSKEMARNHGSAVLLDDSWLSPEPLVPLGQSPLPAVADTDYCRVFLTSGSTGTPKAVALTYRQVALRLLQRETVLGVRLAQSARVFIGVGFSTVPGYTALLHALLRGGAIVLQGENPTERLEAISRYAVQVLFASPQSLLEMLTSSRQAPHGFRKVDLVVPLGSSISPKLARALRENFCHELVSLYGSTELASVATAPMTAVEDIDGAVGYPVPGVSVEILDAQDRPLAPGRVGRIRVRSSCAAAGYVEGSLDSIVPFPEAGMLPGDIGAMTLGGLLVIAGRESSVVNLGGSKISLERIEAALTSFADVEDAAALTFRNEMGIHQLAGAVVWAQNVERVSARKALRKHLESMMPLIHIPGLFVELDKVPRNHMGKIDRELLLPRVLEAIQARLGEEQVEART